MHYPSLFVMKGMKRLPYSCRLGRFQEFSFDATRRIGQILALTARSYKVFTLRVRTEVTT